VDVRLIEAQEFSTSQAYQDQIHVADILIGTKCDLASPEQIEDFFSFTNELYPPKLQARHHIENCCSIRLML
jgi:G3E family GTPase